MIIRWWPWNTRWFSPSEISGLNDGWNKYYDILYSQSFDDTGTDYYEWYWKQS